MVGQDNDAKTIPGQPCLWATALEGACAAVLSTAPAGVLRSGTERTGHGSTHCSAPSLGWPRQSEKPVLGSRLVIFQMKPWSPERGGHLLEAPRLSQSGRNGSEPRPRGSPCGERELSQATDGTSHPRKDRHGRGLSVQLGFVPEQGEGAARVTAAGSPASEGRKGHLSLALLASSVLTAPWPWSPIPLLSPETPRAAPYKEPCRERQGAGVNASCWHSQETVWGQCSGHGPDSWMFLGHHGYRTA